MLRSEASVFFDRFRYRAIPGILAFLRGGQDPAGQGYLATKRSCRAWTIYKPCHTSSLEDGKCPP